LLAEGFAGLPGTEAALALSEGAEILRGSSPPRCAFLLPLYRSVPGLLLHLARSPWLIRRIAREVRRLKPDRAICAMPAPLDLLMMAALRRAGVPATIIVHDADPHPGDLFPLQYRLHRRVVAQAGMVVVLSRHVGERLQAQGALRPGTALIQATHPPFDYAPRSTAAPRAAGEFRVLSFGRLLPYKGLDLLADALTQMGPFGTMRVRVVGHGPESDALEALRRLDGVAVENRWVAEDDIGDLIAWADLVVLPYREASQSGVAAAALAQGKRVLATRVGGLVEQLSGEPNATLCEPDAAGIAAALIGLRDAPPPSGLPKPDGKEAWRRFAAAVSGAEKEFPY
jgi:glycosyltransferase involved in cell wall biosynthesis